MRPLVFLRRTLLSFGVAAILLLAAWVWLRAENDRQLAAWETALATLPDAEVADHFERCPQLGAAAWPALARALGSDRSIVFLAARLELRRVSDEIVARNSDRRLADTSALLRALVEADASNTPRGKSASASIAAKLIAGPWPADADTRPLVAMAQPLMEAGVQEPRTSPDAEPREIDPTALRPTSADVSLRSLRPVDEPPELKSVLLKEPHLAASQPPLRIVVELSEPELSAPAEESPDPSLDAAPNEAISLTSFGDESPERSAWLQKFPGPAPVRELLLRSINGGPDAESARLQLIERDIAGWRYDLLRDMLDTSPAVRRRAVEQAPKRLGAEAVEWLKWLTTDPAAEVRLAAYSYLATSGDPRMLRELASACARDSDPRIRALATRFVK